MLISGLLGRQLAGDVSHQPSSEAAIIFCQALGYLPNFNRRRPWLVPILLDEQIGTCVNDRGSNRQPLDR